MDPQQSFSAKMLLSSDGANVRLPQFVLDKLHGFLPKLQSF